MAAPHMWEGLVPAGCFILVLSLGLVCDQAVRQDGDVRKGA